MEEIKSFSEKGISDRVQELLNMGHDVLIREYEKDTWLVFKKPNEQNREKGRLFIQCYDQDEPRPQPRGWFLDMS